MNRLEWIKNHMKGLKMQFYLAKFEFNFFTGLWDMAKYVAMSKISNFFSVKAGFLGFLCNFCISFDSPHQALSNYAYNINKFGVWYILPYMENFWIFEKWSDLNDFYGTRLPSSSWSKLYIICPAYFPPLLGYWSWISDRYEEPSCKLTCFSGQ